MALININATTTKSSDQVTKIRAVNHTPLNNNELDGRLRIAYFNFEGLAAANDVILLTKLPNCRIISGRVYVENGVTNADMDIGLVHSRTLDDGTIDVLADGLDVDADGGHDLVSGATAGNVGIVVDYPSFVAAKLLTAGLASDSIVRGHIVYAVGA